MGEERREKKSPKARSSRIVKRPKLIPLPKIAPLLEDDWHTEIHRAFGDQTDLPLEARIYEPQEPEPTPVAPDDYWSATLTECARELGVTHSRVQQIQMRALAKLRERPRSRHLLEAWKGVLPPAPEPQTPAQHLEQRTPHIRTPPDQLALAWRRAHMTEEQRHHDSVQASYYGRERWEQMVREDPLLVNPNRRPKPQYYRHMCDGCDCTITTERKGPPWRWSRLARLHNAFRDVSVCDHCFEQLRHEVALWLLQRRAELREARRQGRRPWPRQPKRRFVRPR